PGVDTNYVRENDFQNIVSSPSPTVKKSLVLPMAAFPLRHHKEFKYRNSQNPAAGTESVWAEAYVDKGSKTLVYQPVRNISARFNLTNNPSVIPYLDSSNEFEVTQNAIDASVLIPKELK